MPRLPAITLLSALATLAACQPEQPNDMQGSRAPLASDNTPSKAEPPQSPAPSNDNPNPQGQIGLVPRAPPVAERGDSDPADNSRNPPPQQREDALAACRRQPTGQQEVCRQRVEQALNTSNAKPADERKQ